MADYVSTHTGEQIDDSVEKVKTKAVNWDSAYNSIQSINNTLSDHNTRIDNNKNTISSVNGVVSGHTTKISSLENTVNGFDGRISGIQSTVNSLDSSVLKKSGGSMSGYLYAYNNTSYSTSQVRNIQAGTSDLNAGSSSLTSGSIYIVYE